MSGGDWLKGYQRIEDTPDYPERAREAKRKRTERETDQLAKEKRELEIRILEARLRDTESRLSEREDKRREREEKRESAERHRELLETIAERDNAPAESLYKFFVLGTGAIMSMIGGGLGLFVLIFLLAIAGSCGQ